MSNPTYQDLLTALQRLTPEQLNQTVTVHNADEDEYYPAVFSEVKETDRSNGYDVLSAGHPILIISSSPCPVCGFPTKTRMVNGIGKNLEEETFCPNCEENE